LGGDGLWQEALPERATHVVMERPQYERLQAVVDAVLAWYDDPYAERGAGTGALADAVESYRFRASGGEAMKKLVGLALLGAASLGGEVEP